MKGKKKKKNIFTCFWLPTWNDNTKISLFLLWKCFCEKNPNFGKISKKSLNLRQKNSKFLKWCEIFKKDKVFWMRVIVVKKIRVSVFYINGRDDIVLLFNCHGPKGFAFYGYSTFCANATFFCNSLGCL